MSSRYFVRTVNPHSLNEHFVVADYHQDGACINAYFNLRAAQDEARWLNRHHHRQQLKEAPYCHLSDWRPLTTPAPQIEPMAPENVAVGPVSIFGNSADLRETGSRHHDTRASQERPQSALQNLMHRRLVE
ncbi:hypothetical protein [Salinicola halimionae]|uniref:hypothetical protein n=1 Tax=Salinicola halimionae TaxID=1949081 RepID=UPI0013002447|nr:hypothetical protein [Salinicola halimionae]